ncbi:MAG: hypothetical protein M3Y31_03770 [Gemmatimonadota bacterium]|nr:hypothetical protein [Gemmatimonadota bacterium]
MLNLNTDAGTRTWPNVVVLLMGLTLLGLAMWGGTMAGVRDESASGAAWASHAAAGILALLGFAAAQRTNRRTLARLLVGAAVVALVIGGATFEWVGPRLIMMIVVPAIALAVAIPFLAPVPRANP